MKEQAGTTGKSGATEMGQPQDIEDVTSATLYNSWAVGTMDDLLQAREIEDLQRTFEENAINYYNERHDQQQIFHLADTLPLIREGMTSLVNDEFTRCFQGESPPTWNWGYLLPFWCLGLVFRYCILFPLRLSIFLIGTLIFIFGFTWVTTLMKNENNVMKFQRDLISFWATVWVMAMSGVVKYHGIEPKRREANRIHVANHTSMIDVVLLQQHLPYASVGQKHPGLIGLIQTKLLKCMGCLWFERRDIKDRTAVAKKIEEHIKDPEGNPLLIFPEGTCVNNKYCVMFKKGVFELENVKIYPIAIRYNKNFCDPFWNSRAQSFWRHMFHLMTCWAVVCDIYYLPPQTRREGESSAEFAQRIKEMICKKAKLTAVPWDGYLKHLRPSARFVENRRKIIAASLLRRFPEIIKEEEKEIAPVSSSPLPSEDSDPSSSSPPSPSLKVESPVIERSAREQQAFSNFPQEKIDILLRSRSDREKLKLASNPAGFSV